MKNRKEKKNNKSEKNNKLFKNIVFPIIKKNSFLFILAIILISFSTLLGIFLPIVIKNTIDIDITGKNIQGLYRQTYILFGIILGISLLTFINMYLSEFLGQNFLQSLKRKIFDHVVYLPARYFDQTPVGKLISRIESDAESIRMFFTNTVIMVFNDIFLFTGMIIVMMKTSVPLTLIVMLIVPLLVLFSIWYKNRVYPLWLKFRKVFSKLTGYSSDFIKASPIIKIFRLDRWAMNKISRTNHELFRLNIASEFCTIIYYNSLLVFESLAIALIMWFTVFKSSFISVGLSIGTLFMFITYIRNFFGPIKNLSSQFQQIQRAFAALHRINGILNIEGETIGEKGINSFQKSIVFDNVTFSYDREKIVLKDVSFSINKGEKIALVGRTGSGKTTITSLLLRLYDGYEGSIKIDGNELSSLNRQSLRNFFSVVFQENYMFPDTILNNIITGKDIPRERVETAIRQLGLEYFFKRFTENLDTEIKDDSKNISSGERQLISIVRAYIHNPEIIILDEATASIDNETETLIYSAFNQFMENKTAVIVAHRLSTIRNCDKIIVFHHGMIKETGTYEELAARKGVFWDMVQSQIHGDISDQDSSEEDMLLENN